MTKSEQYYIDLWRAEAFNTARYDQELTTKLAKIFLERVQLQRTDALYKSRQAQGLTGRWLTHLVPDIATFKVEFKRSPTEVINQLKANGETDMSFPWYGAFGERWLAYYEYLIAIDDIDKLTLDFYTVKAMIAFAKQSHFMQLCSVTMTAYISERPVEIHVDDREFFHNPNGPALLYADGTALWSIHNTVVPKEIILTPADQLDAKLILTQRNAQVRAEIVRKIGIQRVIKDLGATVVHESNGYKLLELDLGNDVKRRYLQMTNPSVAGMIHVEAVPPTTATCEEAHAWREGRTEYISPLVLT